MPTLVSNRGERVPIRQEIANWFTKIEEREEEAESKRLKQQLPVVRDIRLRPSKTGFTLYVSASESSPEHPVPVGDVAELVQFGKVQKLVKMHAGLHLSASPTFWSEMVCSRLLEDVQFRGEGKFTGLRETPRSAA